MQWYQKYRPKKLADIVGQDQAVKTVESLFARKAGFPRAVVFTGSYGTGKSSMAAVVANKLGCRGSDLQIVNCATMDPMETVREVESMMHMGGMSGPCRVWVMEEIQSMSRSNFAQQGLLRVLEDETNQSSYFLLTTTDPGKVLPAVLSRCTKVELKPIKSDPMHLLLRDVMCREHESKEGDRYLSDDEYDKIVELADGSARSALVMLEKITGLPADSNRIAALSDAGAEKAGIDLCRALLAGQKWPQIAAILKALTEDPEKVRRGVLGYANSVLLGGGAKAGQAALMIEAFAENYYDTGKVGLTKSCWDVAGTSR